MSDVSRTDRAAVDRLELERFVPYRLSVLTNTVSRSIARLYGERFRLTIPEWRVTAVLGQLAPLSAGEVCARTAMDKVRVSRAIARLLKAGLVDRSTDPKDRRRSVLRLSPKGEEVYHRIVPLARGVEAELLAVLTRAERAELDRLLAKLQARAAALGTGGSEPHRPVAGSDEPRPGAQGPRRPPGGSRRRRPL